MHSKHGAFRLAAAIGSVALISALIVGSAGPAVARSRAANRWNDVLTSHPRTAVTDHDEPRSRDGRTIRLDEPFSDSFTFIDVGAPGDSPGDYGVFQDPVVDPASGATRGTITVQCVAAYADLCRGSISLDGRGQITFDGITPLGVDPDEFGLTGGTGEFTGAGGSLTVSFLTQTTARLTVQLSRSKRH
jgi:hypothetical protein